MPVHLQEILKTWSAGELIQHAKDHPPDPVINGLLNVGDVLLIHGTEESFKSVFVVQMAESIARATPLLRRWDVPRSRRVGIIETEMHEVMLGERLSKMFPSGDAPPEMRFLSGEAMQEFRRRKTLQDKFQLVRQWVEQEKIDVLMLDTANDFFRNDDNPSDEPTVGSFFDNVRQLQIKACIMVRHDRKRKADDAIIGSTNELIRGSAEWKEDPECIVYLERKDRRTNEVGLAVGKLRYGRKPEPLAVWFDAGCFRLTPLSPVISVLERGPLSRQKLVSECGDRFGLRERKVDAMLKGLRPHLLEKQAGHQKVFEIDWSRTDEADWHEFLVIPEAGVGDVQTYSEGVEDMQDCISSTLS